jgi:RNA ligase (TIGR02306 family)
MGLAYIGQVEKLMPIAKADRIESAEVFCGVGGRWTGVVKRGQFALGDRALVYLQDAVVQPSEELKFLEVSKWRVKMARFRGAPSECVILPAASDEPVGTDLTEALGIVKYVKVLPHNLAGDAIGPFPSFIPKTDEPNFQTAAELIEALRGKPWYARVKVDGSSTTAFKHEGRFGSAAAAWNSQIRRAPTGEWRSNTNWPSDCRMDLRCNTRPSGRGFRRTRWV